MSGRFDNDTIAALFHRDKEELLREVKNPEVLSVMLATNVNAALYIKGFSKQLKTNQWNLESMINLAKFQSEHNLFISGELNFETLYYLFDGYNDYLYELPNYVEKIQIALNKLGYEFGKIDGKWGPKTEAALKKLQSENSLEETGKIDKQTKRLLFIGNTF